MYGATGSSPSPGSSTRRRRPRTPTDHYPPDEIIARETKRNRAAFLYPPGCRLRLRRDRPQRAHCGPFYDDFEARSGWALDPDGDRHRRRPAAWQRGDPALTSTYGHPRQLDVTTSGSRALVTGAAIGTSTGANDLDGTTTIRSSPIAAAGQGRAPLVPLLPGPRRERLARRLVPRLGGGGGRHAHPRPRGAGRRGRRRSRLGVGPGRDGSVGRADGADRHRGRRRGHRQPRRGCRGRRPDRASRIERGAKRVPRRRTSGRLRACFAGSGAGARAVAPSSRREKQKPRRAGRGSRRQ